MQEFEQFLIKQQLRSSTIKEYVPAVIRFVEWYEHTVSSFDITKLENSDISVTYSDYLINERKLHANTVNKQLAALRKWLEYHQRAGRFNDAIDIRNVPISTNNTPRSLSRKDVSAILYAIEQEKNPFLRSRDRCMVFLGLYRGFRTEDVVSLNIDDVVMTQGRQKIIVRESKGGVFSEVDLSGSKRLIGAINDWLDERRKSKFAHSPYFFISFRSSRPTQGVIDKMIKRLQDRSGVDFTFHVLRHTFGYRVQQITKDIRKTKEAMRHSDIRSTVIYTQPTKEDMQNIYSQLEEW